MRRKNKPRVVWLPTSVTNSVDGAVATTQLAVLPVPAVGVGNRAVLEIPVTQDGTLSDPAGPNSSLADITASGYRLRRIVGKVYCFIGQTGAPTSGQFAVSAGFIIRRMVVNPANDLETGFSMAASAGGDNIDPQVVGNSMDPWIWRRTWLLANNGAAGTLFGDTPSQNFGAQYPGPLEGPHVDQKTARIVGPEERLYLSFGVTDILGTDVATSLVVITDLRVLASMRTNIGNRRNASR